MSNLSHRTLWLGLGFTIWTLLFGGICLYSSVYLTRGEKTALDIEADHFKNIIEDDFKKFVFGLQGTAGVFITENFKFDPNVFRKYAKSRNNFDNFHGSLGIGFIRAVKRSELESYNKIMKQVMPKGAYPNVDTELNMIIELIEPAEKNSEAVGLNVAFEENRREAALLAVESGHPTITKPVSLVQRKDATGFLYFLALYRDGSVPKNLEQRWDDLVGWVYSPIVLEDLADKISNKLPDGYSATINVPGSQKVIHLGDQFENSRFLDLKTRKEIHLDAQTWSLEVDRNPKNLERGLFAISIILMLAIFTGIFGVMWLNQYLKQTDRGLVEKTLWMDGIVASAGHAVIATSTEGEITTFNPAAEKLLGYSQSELVKRFSPEIFHDRNEVELRAKVLSIELKENVTPGFGTFVAKALRCGSDTNEWTYIRKDGTRVSVRLCVTAILGPEGKPVGFLGIAEDLTEQKKLEDLINQQRSKMVASAKMSILGEMAGGIAHEINTPLSVITTAADIIKMTLPVGTNQSTVDQVDVIEKTAFRIGKIVKGLRTFARNSDSDPFERATISSIVNMTLDLCRERLTNHSIKLRLNLGTDPKILCRPAEISQVLMNLIGNSIDAIEGLNQKWIEIQSSLENQKVAIKVIDSGHGIPPMIAEKIMLPFFTTKEIGKGTGLGLSISSGIVSAHGGTLTYEVGGPNTCFRIDLPVEKSISV